MSSEECSRKHLPGKIPETGMVQAAPQNMLSAKLAEKGEACAAGGVSSGEFNLPSLRHWGLWGTNEKKSDPAMQRHQRSAPDMQNPADESHITQTHRDTETRRQTQRHRSAHQQTFTQTHKHTCKPTQRERTKERRKKERGRKTKRHTHTNTWVCLQMGNPTICGFSLIPRQANPKRVPQRPQNPPEPFQNPSPRLRTTPKPIWAETPKPSPVGENQKHLVK